MEPPRETAPLPPRICPPSLKESDWMDQSDEEDYKTDAAMYASAEFYKNKGNKYFQSGHYDVAIDRYSKAIRRWPSAALFGNRAFAYIKKEQFGLAMEDITCALELDEGYVKAYFRRATCYMATGKFSKALRDYEAVCTVAPQDADAKKKRDECKKIVQCARFLKAIQVNHDKKDLPELVNWEAMEVPDSYDGPRLDGPITAQFMLELIEYQKRQKNLHEKYAYKILLDTYAYLKTQPNMVEIEFQTPDQEFTVCGDIHGQYYDLCNIFDLRGFPCEKTPYLFNGDFVDRGSFSVECILVLFGFKLLLPHHFFLARGNHESDTMNKMYGFEGEVKAKYSSKMVDFFTEIFNWLPLCHLIDKDVFVCHGGLFAEDGVTLADIQKVDRVQQPPNEGIMCDLLWADPMNDRLGRFPSKRGTSIQFGRDVTARWCKENDLKYIIRSHEVKPDGWEEQPGSKCFTLFSAPNYCDTIGNKGAFAVITRKHKLRPRFVEFMAVPHPPVPAMRFANNLFNV